MHRITVLGLGPGDARYLTVEALEALRGAERLLLRTMKHPTVDYLRESGIGFETFDALYDEAETFDEVYEEIVRRLMAMAEEGPVTYAVPGNPFVAERTVELLNAQAVDVEYIYGVSFIDAVLTLLRLDPVGGLAVVDALNPGKLDTGTTQLVIQVYNQIVAADVKLYLGARYPDEHPVLVVQSAGVSGKERVIERPLSDLDRYDDYDHLTSLVIPPVAPEARIHEFDDLVGIMRTLRGENGCPWDRKQTHESLKRHLIEEAYEVVEAIDHQDSEHLEEELGDVLLQVVFHGLIEEESGYFTLDDVTDTLSRKLIRRHPHVFGEESAQTPEEVETIWAGVKKEERQSTHTDRMRELTGAVPALMRAAKVQKIAREVGFDWDDVAPALEKVEEEYQELLAEIRSGETRRSEEELGDLLFAVVNVARLMKIDPEIALDRTIRKFIDRFSYIETKAGAAGRTMESMTLEEMDQIWEESKRC